MDNSIGTSIEKIKLLEQDIENKLKEKREQDAEYSALNRAIKEAISQAAKLDQEQFELSKRIQKLRPLLEIEKIQREAILAQLEIYTKVLQDLKAQSNQGIAKVWSLRASLCDTVQNVSDGCDIRALLMRPMCTDPITQLQSQAVNNKNVNYVNDSELINSESRLNTAQQRLKDIEAKRQKLLAEPDTGEEFIRIKNALRYSMQKTANLQN